MEYPLTQRELDIFSNIQIFLINNKKNMTYEELISNCDELTTHKQVSIILKKTFLGVSYEVGDKGRNPLVGDVQMDIFKEKLEEAADQNRAISYFDAITLLQQIQGDYLYVNYKRAIELGCRQIAQSLLFEFEKDLSFGWFSTTLSRWGIEVKTAEKLEAIRNKYCHSEVLRNFYDNIIRHLPSDPRLLYNADETASSFNSKGKVVVPNGRYPVRYDESIGGHFTSICAFNADGSNVLKPYIILPKLRSFPDDLGPMKNWAFFVSSPSGWINGRLFVAFCVYFCHVVSQFHAQEQITENAWLILDGHKSRANSVAVEYCARHGVNLVILPAHTTHVTQPFDVGLAAPMKTKIRQLFDKPAFFIQTLAANAATQTAKTRIRIVAAIINAWWATATPGNCASAFAKAGIYPFDLQIVLDNKFVRTTTAEDAEEPERGIKINGCIITTDEKRIEIAEHFYKRQFPNVAAIPSRNSIDISASFIDGAETIFSVFPLLQENVLPGIYFHHY